MERQYVVNCSALGTGGRAAEGTGLLNRRTGYTGTAGSNPALSVDKDLAFIARSFFTHFLCIFTNWF